MTLSMKVENTKILLWHLTQFHLSIYKVETYLYAHDQIKEVTLTTIETDYNSLKFSPLFYVLDKNKITGMFCVVRRFDMKLFKSNCSSNLI